MTIQSAMAANCNLLLFEDLQHGFQLGSLTIQNPFVYTVGSKKYNEKYLTAKITGEIEERFKTKREMV